jgi:serine/threonine-protein kinase
MLTGRPPFTGETAVSVAYQHVSEQAPAPSSINPSISSAIDSVVMKSLAKERDARFQSASEFRAALVASVNGQSVQSFDDGSQPATAPMQPIDVEELAATVLQPQIPESDLFTELLASANDEATGAINSVPDTATRVLSEELDGFTQLGFETGSTQVISTNVKPRNSTDKPSAGLLWGFASGAAVLVIGLVVWLLAGGASLINFGGGGASKILVADVIGKTYEDAYTTLTKQKLLVDKQLQLSDTVALGTVISTDPPAGQQVGAKTTITVLVSSGKEQVLMPDLRGLTEQEATVALADAKLALGTITQADSATVAQNLVISSEPTANQNVAAGTVVNLVISTGMVTVPNVVNLDQNDAISQLSSPQVGYIVESQVDPTCLGTAGTTVIAQSIIPGSQPQLQTIILTLECIN